MTEASYLLYTTAACHLCEQAQKLLATLPLKTGIPIDLVDIADDEALVARYGVRIPVLVRLADGEELQWPFDSAQALAYFSGIQGVGSVCPLASGTASEFQT